MHGPAGPRAGLYAVLLLAALYPGRPAVDPSGLIEPEQVADARPVLVQDTSPRWVVGIAALKGADLAPERRYLIYSIPLLIKENLESVRFHRFSEEESEAYRRRLLELSLRRQCDRIDSIRRTREKAFFLSGTAYRPDSFRGELRREEAVLASLKELDAEELSFPEEKELEILRGEELGDLLAAPRYSAGEAARKHGLDLLIWGELEEIQGYLYVRLMGYHAALGREIFCYEDAARVEELFGVLQTLVRELGCAVRGMDCAYLTVVPSPPDSAVEINGRWMGAGRVEAVVENGEVSVRVTHPDREEALVQLRLEAKEVREVDVELAPKPRGHLSLRTIPEGAAVYMGAVWVGNTPLLIDAVPEGQQVLLKKEGYRDASFRLSPDSGDELALPLRKELYDEDAWQKRRRDRFYGSLGLFVLSVPVPLFLYSYAVDNAYAAMRFPEGTPEYDRFERRTEIFYYGYLGGLFVSATLFLNMGVDLLEYVRNAFL